MKHLRRLFVRLRDVRTVAMLVAYVALAEEFTSFRNETVPTALVLGALGVALGHYALRRWERIQHAKAATHGHQKAQEVLSARVDELDKTVKSLTNALGGGAAWK